VLTLRENDSAVLFIAGHPQLKATAVILGSKFATRLERAIRRSRGELIEAQAVDEAIN
jgi:hypothetical protein